MPYESKPMKKQWVEVDGKMTPIILPQIWSHEKQDWVVTSEQNPLPTQITGSMVDEIEVLEPKAITNTNVQNLLESVGYNIDTTKYIDIDFLITNTHDQPVRVLFRPNAVNAWIMLDDGSAARYSSYVNDAYHIIPANVNDMPLSSVPARKNGDGASSIDRSPFKKYLIENFRASYRFNEAPTEGSISVTLIGVRK